MNVEQFIQDRVDRGRGAFRPEEVKQLIRLAWQGGKEEQQQGFNELCQRASLSTLTQSPGLA